MKSTILLTCSLLVAFSGLTAAQSVKIMANPPSVVVSRNGEKERIPCKVSDKNLNDFLVVSKTGYITQASTAEQLLKAGGPEYTFNLDKVNKPAIGFKSKKIEFTKFVDGTNKLGKAKVSYNFWYVGISQPINLSDSRFSRAANEVMAEWGFDMVGTNSLFEESVPADLAVAGEVLATGKDTQGPGFQISIMVTFSVYDKTKKEVVLEMTTGGYSDSQSEVEFSDELSYALKDALVGLMSSARFQELAVMQ